MPPVTFEAAFLTRWPGSTEFQVLAYTGDVDPAALLSGLENSTPPAPLDIPIVDTALAARGYRRTGKWVYTDDIWGSVVTDTGVFEVRRAGQVAPAEPYVDYVLTGDPQLDDLGLRGVLAQAELNSSTSEHEWVVTRRGSTSEIARYCGGKRVL